VVVEQAKQPGRIRVGGQFLHGVGVEGEPAVVTELVGLLQHPGNVVHRHGAIRGALRPAVPADGEAAHGLDAQIHPRHRAALLAPTEGFRVRC
jgi:hypothetical protein